MKWSHNRILLFAWTILLLALVTIGCSSKEDPSETLTICGNHSCGDMYMVTSDTSSEGFHYLNPSLSPDGTRILFSADWLSYPSAIRDYDNAPYTSFRQIMTIPRDQMSFDPMDSLATQGAELIRVTGTSIPIGGSGSEESLTATLDSRKGDPIWIDDNKILFWLTISRGNRFFMADISDPSNAVLEPVFLEEEDNQTIVFYWQHMEPTLSPDGRWLAFTRSGCAIPDSFESCTNLTLQVLDMETAGAGGYGYDAHVFPLTNEYSRIEKPSWSPDGSKIVFSGGMDVGGSSGFGTELYTIDFDTTGLSTGDMALDNNLDRLTYTDYSSGDPILGMLNTSPQYTNDGSEILFVSTRRVPSITLRDRNIWSVPSDGSLDPEIYFHTRSDDYEPSMNPDGSILLSTTMGFSESELNRLEEEAYQDIFAENEAEGLGKSEVVMRGEAADVRQGLEFFEGVMSHIYIFNP
jgi:Tol biopolymer transport system component